MHMLYVSDGKAGHRAQALGLFAALQQQRSTARLHEVSIGDLPLSGLLFALLCYWLRCCFSIIVQSQKPPVQIPQLPQLQPNWIVGVGSHSHLRVMLLKCCFPHSKSIILMKPSWPLGCFDAVIAPQHDGLQPSSTVFCTLGVLNPLQNEQRHQRGRILIAVGGSSKRHRFESAAVLQQIQQIVAQHPQAQILLTTSRRTPADFLSQLQAQISATQLAVYPVAQTPQGWIFEQMQLAEAFWVTEDSVSMLYEGLTAGCRVGVIAVMRLKQDRVTRGVDGLLQKGRIAASTQLAQLPSAKPLNEAARVATWLLNESGG